MQLPKYKNQTKKNATRKSKEKNLKKIVQLIGVERTGKEAPASVESEKKTKENP